MSGGKGNGTATKPKPKTRAKAILNKDDDPVKPAVRKPAKTVVEPSKTSTTSVIYWLRTPTSQYVRRYPPSSDHRAVRPHTYLYAAAQHHPPAAQHFNTSPESGHLYDHNGQTSPCAALKQENQVLKRQNALLLEHIRKTEKDVQNRLHNVSENVSYMLDQKKSKSDIKSFMSKAFQAILAIVAVSVVMELMEEVAEEVIEEVAEEMYEEAAESFLAETNVGFADILNAAFAG